jgi:hypothetical protein
MLSSCSSLEKLCVRGRPGVTRLPIATSASAIGPLSTRVARTGSADSLATVLAWVRPTPRGLDPTRTKDAAIMISALNSSAHHHSRKV